MWLAIGGVAYRAFHRSDEVMPPMFGAALIGLPVAVGFARIHPQPAT